MTAEAKLNRVRSGWQEFRRLNDRLAELEVLAEKVTPTLSDMPKPSGGSQKDDTWAALIDYRISCEEQLRQYLKDCKDLEEELNCIESPRIRTAMKYRYVDGLKQQDIADKMNYEWRTVARLLKQGKKIYCNTYGDDDDD